MLCDMMAFDPNTLPCFGDGAETCALPSGTCLTADQIERLGADVSQGHAALLARHRKAHGGGPRASASASARGGDRPREYRQAERASLSAAQRAAATKMFDSAYQSNALAPSGARDELAPRGVETQAFSIGCGGTGASTACMAEGSVNPCSLIRSDCTLTASASMYPCTTPSYALIRVTQFYTYRID
jgi:hypothetical protein